MGKYRGKHNGITRGHYEKALLYAEINSEKQAKELDDKVSYLFLGLGYRSDPNSYFVDNAHDMLSTYHVAGATITLSTTKNFKPVDTYCMTPEEIEIAEQKRVSKKPFSQIYMVSNQGLSDIITKIKKEYPIFKERPLDRLRWF
jgi:hypothetical protein